MEAIADLDVLSAKIICSSRPLPYPHSIFPLSYPSKNAIPSHSKQDPLPLSKTNPLLPTRNQTLNHHLQAQTPTSTKQASKLETKNSPIHHDPPPHHAPLVQVRNDAAKDADGRRPEHAAQEPEGEERAPLCLAHDRLAEAREHEEGRARREDAPAAYQGGFTQRCPARGCGGSS